MSETDLVKLAEREVIEKGKNWLRVWRDESRDAERVKTLADAQCEVLAALVLLESREAMVATTHLDPPVTYSREDIYFDHD